MTAARDTLADGALAALAQEGDEAAFAEIMHRHRAALYRLALGFTGNADDALDLVQDSFVAAFRNLARYDRTRALRPWLSTIALNRCRDWRRKQKVRALFLPAATVPDVIIQASVDDAPDPETVVADKANLAALIRHVATLPATLRDCLLLRTVEGLSQIETAEALGITAKAVETRLARARSQLAEKFSR